MPSHAHAAMAKAFEEPGAKGARNRGVEVFIILSMSVEREVQTSDGRRCSYTKTVAIPKLQDEQKIEELSILHRASPPTLIITNDISKYYE